jgi:hypothetical protein
MMACGYGHSFVRYGVEGKQQDMFSQEARLRQSEHLIAIAIFCRLQQLFEKLLVQSLFKLTRASKTILAS